MVFRVGHCVDFDAATPIIGSEEMCAPSTKRGVCCSWILVEDIETTEEEAETELGPKPYVDTSEVPDSEWSTA